MALNNKEFVCYRCGSCCMAPFATVPKYVNSDLSPDFLDNLRATKGDKVASEYFKEHGILPSGRCKWLQDGPDGTTTCLVHERRGSDCRNYPASGVCRVGKLKIEDEGKFTFEQIAHAGLLNHLITDENVHKAFYEQTGFDITVLAGSGPIDTIVDKTTGYEKELILNFIVWATETYRSKQDNIEHIEIYKKAKDFLEEN